MTAEDRRARERPQGAPVLSLAELESVRLILRGGSVVDWYRLNFEGDDDILRFLRVLEADLEDERDRRRLNALRSTAASYLREEHNYRVPDELVQCPGIDLFAFASELRGRRRDRFYACLLLKVMHIFHHVQARELRYRLPLSNSELGTLLIRKVDSFVESLRAEQFPLMGYRGGEKEVTSMVTKLLVKQQHHAAAIRDRVRFHFTVEKTSDLVPMLHRMASRLIPFNYVVPAKTVNQLVNFTALIESHASYRARASELQVELGHEEHAARGLNEFSGPTYRVINFVADIPIRVPDSVLEADPSLAELGPVIFGLAEFQIVDEATEEENQSGDNSHDAYKARQKRVVRERLARGLRNSGADEEIDSP